MNNYFLEVSLFMFENHLYEFEVLLFLFRLADRRFMNLRRDIFKSSDLK